jgi:hypothetical protein
MIGWIKRRWFWFGVRMGWRDRPPPLTPQMITKEALILFEKNLAGSAAVRVRLRDSA